MPLQPHVQYSKFGGMGEYILDAPKEAPRNKLPPRTSSASSSLGHPPPPPQGQEEPGEQCCSLRERRKFPPPPATFPPQPEGTSFGGARGALSSPPEGWRKGGLFHGGLGFAQKFLSVPGEAFTCMDTRSMEHQILPK